MLLEWAKNIVSQPAFLALRVQGIWIWKKYMKRSNSQCMKEIQEFNSINLTPDMKQQKP